MVGWLVMVPVVLIEKKYSVPTRFGSHIRASRESTIDNGVDKLGKDRSSLAQRLLTLFDNIP